MANYKEEVVSGNKWQRCHRIEISNPYVGNKTVAFYEQELVVLTSEEVIQKSVSVGGPGGLFVMFDANTVIDVINPYTLQPTGQTFTHGELYVMLFSAYMDAANKRDISLVNLNIQNSNTANTIVP